MAEFPSPTATATSPNEPAGQAPAQRELRPPRVALRVAVIGAREFGPNDAPPPDWLPDRLNHLFRVIACELHAVRKSGDYFDKDAPPLLRVISGLADGADQIGARAALNVGAPQAGLPAEVQLFCILPFPRPEYEQTIKARNRPEFNDLLAAATKVLILDGRYEPKDEAKPEREKVLRQRREQRGYRAQGWFTRQQADLLIAVWDPMREGKPGGTEDTMRRALHAGTPVAWINPGVSDPARQRLLRDPGELEVILNGGDPLDLRPGGAQAPYDFQQELRERGVAALVALAREKAPAKRPGFLRRLRYRLEGRSPTGSKAPAQDKALEEYFSGWVPPKTTLRGRLWDRVVLRPLAGRKLTEEETRRLKGLEKKKAARLEPFDSHYDRADALASHYASLYRGAFALNYLFGALALFFAALGALLHGLGWSPWVVLACAAVELVLVLLILGNTIHSRMCGDHWRSITYRVLADLLRPMAYLGRLGCSTPSPHLPAVYEEQDLRLSWMSWLVGAVVRAAPALPPGPGQVAAPSKADVDQCLSRVTDGWLADQELYHTKNERRMRRAHHFIEFVGLGLFLLAAAATAIEMGLLIHYLRQGPAEGGAEGGGHSAWTAVLSLFSIWLPALALFAHGLGQQAEFRRLGERSAMMAKRLAFIERPRLKRLERQPMIDLGCQTWSAALESYLLAQVMVDELADWSLIYQMHDVAL